MLENVSQWVVIAFGIFFIVVGFLMLFQPRKAREILRKAGSTNFINYAEITIRMIPAAGMILYAEFSKFPEIFKIFGGFMIITSLVLFLVPRKMHQKYSTAAADFLKPFYFQIISPFAFLIGSFIIYSVA